MSPLTDAADQASVITPPRQAPAGNRKRSLADVLADPRARLGAGTAALLVTAMAVRRDRVGPCEAAAFRAANGLPGWLYPGKQRAPLNRRSPADPSPARRA